MKTKRAFGFYAAALACILSVVALALYGKVLNLDKRTYTFLGIAVGCLALTVVISFVGNLGGSICPSILLIAAAALLAYSVVLAAGPMVNQIGWCIAGLDPMSKITSFITFEVLAVLALIFTWIGAFAPTVKEA